MELVKQLREEAERLSGHSIDHGVQEYGIAANLAERAANTIEELLFALKNILDSIEIQDDRAVKIALEAIAKAEQGER